jgi:hypothetical protein
MYQIWEPILARILTSTDTHAIDEVWTWDSFQHGDAALLNSENMAGFCTNFLISPVIC